MSARFRVRAAATLVAALALVSIASPAAAHDELIASSPASGEALQSAPAQVDMTFSAQLMEIGAAVIVADGSDADWVGGDPVIEGDTVTVPLLDTMPDGAYEIRWRVVSSDGHPISGVIPFTVGDVSAIDGGDGGTDGAADTETTTTAESGSAQDGGIPRAVWIGAIGAAAALGLFVLILFLLRGRGTRARGGSDDEPRES